MIIRRIVFIVSLFLTVVLPGTVPASEATSLEEAKSMAASEGKRVLLELYVDD